VGSTPTQSIFISLVKYGIEMSLFQVIVGKSIGTAILSLEEKSLLMFYLLFNPFNERMTPYNAPGLSKVVACKRRFRYRILQQVNNLRFNPQLP
jgi:hypothetical protein